LSIPLYHYSNWGEAPKFMSEENGTIHAEEKIEVYPPSRVAGDIQAPVVLIESGVIFNENYSMKV